MDIDSAHYLFKTNIESTLLSKAYLSQKNIYIYSQVRKYLDIGQVIVISAVNNCIGVQTN